MISFFVLTHGQVVKKSGTSKRELSLSENGAVQSISIAPVLEDLNLDFVFCSPYLHCRETVTPYIQKTSMLMNIHQGLKDFDFLEDRDHLSEQEWHASLKVQTRLSKTLQQIAENHEDARILLSTHSSVLSVLLKLADPEISFAEAQELNGPVMYHLVLDGEKLRVEEKCRLPIIHLSLLESPLAAEIISK